MAVALQGEPVSHAEAHSVDDLQPSVGKQTLDEPAVEPEARSRAQPLDDARLPDVELFLGETLFPVALRSL